MSLSAFISWVILNVHKFLIFLIVKWFAGEWHDVLYLPIFVQNYEKKTSASYLFRGLFLFAQSVVLPVKRQQDNLPLTHAPHAM